MNTETIEDLLVRASQLVRANSEIVTIQRRHAWVDQVWTPKDWVVGYMRKGKLHGQISHPKLADALKEFIALQERTLRWQTTWNVARLNGTPFSEKQLFNSSEDI